MDEKLFTLKNIVIKFFRDSNLYDFFEIKSEINHGPQDFHSLHGIRGGSVKNCIFQTRVFQDKTIKVVVSEQFTENISNWVENWVIQMIFDHSILLIVSVQNFAKTAILKQDSSIFF